MKRTTEQVGKAFLQGKRCKVNNTSTDGANVYLFGNLIARRMPDGTVQVRNAGHPTITTRDRLNGLARLMGSDLYFGQVKYVQTYSKNGDVREWDGEWIQL